MVGKAIGVIDPPLAGGAAILSFIFFYLSLCRPLGLEPRIQLDLSLQRAFSRRIWLRVDFRRSAPFPEFSGLQSVKRCMPGRPLQKDVRFSGVGCRNLSRRDRFIRIRHIFLHQAFGIENAKPERDDVGTLGSWPDRRARIDRGRLTAAHMIASNWSMAIGGIAWGALAAFEGLEFTLHTVSILLLVSLPLLFRFSIEVVQGLGLELAPGTPHGSQDLVSESITIKRPRSSKRLDALWR